MGTDPEFLTRPRTIGALARWGSGTRAAGWAVQASGARRSSESTEELASAGAG